MILEQGRVDNTNYAGCLFLSRGGISRSPPVREHRRAARATRHRSMCGTGLLSVEESKLIDFAVDSYCLSKLRADVKLN